MIYPTVKQLTKDQFNRYELVVAVAKCARIVTDEYIDIRSKAQKMIDNHETEKSLSALIPSEYKDNKAVKIAIAKLESGRFRMAHPEDVEAVKAEIEREALEAKMLLESTEAEEVAGDVDEEETDADDSEQTDESENA